MPGRLQCTLVTFACFLLVSHVCFAMTCHDSRLFVCISVCHAANDPETYKYAVDKSIALYRFRAGIV